MKLTSPSLKKLRWLLQSPAFCKSPVAVLARICYWEWLRICNKGIQMRYDDRYVIDLLPNEGASRLTFYFGLSEPDLFRLYDEFIKPGMIVFDVGANIGLHSLYIANRVAPSGKVFSFEPVRNIFLRLKSHVLNNKVNNISLHNCALGEKPGVLSFSENREDTSRSFVFHADESTTEELLAPVETIDRFVKQNDIRHINFLKIDVEGFEENVLRGADESLSASIIDIIQVELDESSASRNGNLSRNAVEFLSQKGYLMAQWDTLRNCFQPATRVQYNTFFIHSRVIECSGLNFEQ